MHRPPLIHERRRHLVEPLSERPPEMLKVEVRLHRRQRIVGWRTMLTEILGLLYEATSSGRFTLDSSEDPLGGFVGSAAAACFRFPGSALLISLTSVWI